jgi:hypothetical protein
MCSYLCRVGEDLFSITGEGLCVNGVTTVPFPSMHALANSPIGLLFIYGNYIYSSRGEIFAAIDATTMPYYMTWYSDALYVACWVTSEILRVTRTSCTVAGRVARPTGITRLKNRVVVASEVDHTVCELDGTVLLTLPMTVIANIKATADGGFIACGGKDVLYVSPTLEVTPLASLDDLFVRDVEFGDGRLLLATHRGLTSIPTTLLPLVQPCTYSLSYLQAKMPLLGSMFHGFPFLRFVPHIPPATLKVILLDAVALFTAGYSGSGSAADGRGSALRVFFGGSTWKTRGAAAQREHRKRMVAYLVPEFMRARRP